jgi:tetratricopeptide (TPR) repeat protein
MVLTNVSNYYGTAGDHVRAIEILEQQIEITQRLSNLYGESIGLLNLGYEYMILGQYDMCIKRMEQSIHRSESIGARHQSAFTRLNLALAYWRLQRIQDARQTLDKVIPELVSAGDAFGQAVGHTYLGLVLEQGGSIETALQQYSEAGQILREMGAIGNLSDALAGLARCTLALGYLPEALQYCEETWEYLQQTSGKGMELPQLAYLTCFKVFNTLGEADKARLALEQGLQDLNENAARINKPGWKQSFLENIPEHRKLREAWKQIYSKGSS